MKLYHYTTRNGLYGILNTQALWATHCKFLNDYTETELIKLKLIEDLRRRLGDRAKYHVDNMYDTLDNEFYIASFCGEHMEGYINENGLLSQWRGYGKDRGYALVFNAQKLETILQLEAAKFNIYVIRSPVIYSDDDVRFKSELSALRDEVNEYVEEGDRLIIRQITGGVPTTENPPSDFNKQAQRAFPSFIKCVSLYKHRGFKEENEVRIVVWPNKPLSDPNRQDKERKFREKDGVPYIPYIELFDSGDINLQIEKIIVGPHKDKEARASALRIMLRNTNIDVTVSDIPYIG